MHATSVIGTFTHGARAAAVGVPGLVHVLGARGADVPDPESVVPVLGVTAGAAVEVALAVVTAVVRVVQEDTDDPNNF